MGRTEAPSKVPAILLLSGILFYLLAVLLSGLRSNFNLVDDALILCRYADNAAGGLGWVFNPGERVEAHSSPLLVALLSGGASIGMDVPWFSRSLGVLAGLGLVVSSARAFHRFFPGGVALVLTLAVALDSGLAVWAMSGLETALFALLVFLSVLAAWEITLRNSSGWRLGFLAGAVTLTRPEGVLLGALLISGVALAIDGSARRGRILLQSGLVWSIVSGAFFLWRFSYYGRWIPTSLASKWIPGIRAFAPGFVPVLSYGLRHLPLVLLATLALRPESRTSDDSQAGSLRRQKNLLIAALLAGFFFLEMILAGGDWMGADRITLPALPLLALVAGFGFPDGKTWRSLGLSLVLAGALSTWILADRIPSHGHAAQVIGEWLGRTWPKETLIGVTGAGAVPYYSGLPAVDVLGISDPMVAATPPAPGAAWKPGHMRYDLDRFLSREPEVIVWEFGRTWCEARLREPARAGRSGDYRRELLYSERFRREYHLMAGAPSGSERWFCVFRRDPGRDPRPE